MSARTPGLQQRSQYHSYWGQYQYNTSGTPPLPYNGRSADPGSQALPNAPLNPLSNPEFSKLEAGDIAATIDANAPIDGNEFGLWFCVYPGTVGGGDAVWARLDNQAVNVQQVVRDAHVIVVAQDSYLNSLALVPSPPLSANGLNLQGVGDAVDITCDYLDPGDGSQLEQALLAAAAGAVAVDIRLRACDISISPPAVTSLPLVLPANCSLIGAGKGASTLTGGDGQSSTTQDILEAGVNTLVADISFVSPAPAVPPGAGLGLLRVSSGTEVRSCQFTLKAGATARTTGACIRNSASAGTLENVNLHDLQFTLPKAQQANLPFTAVAFAVDTSSWLSGCAFIEDLSVIGGQCAVLMLNAETAKIRGVLHRGAFAPQTVSYSINTNFFASPTVVKGLHVSDVHLDLDDNGQVDSVTFSALRCVDIVVANQNAGGTISLRGAKISEVTAQWGETQVTTQPVEGIRLTSDTGAGASSITDASISDCAFMGLYNAGVVIAAEANGTVLFPKISNVQARQSNGTFATTGFDFSNSGGNFRGAGLMNCAAFVAGSSSIGLNVGTGVVDTIVVGNHLLGVALATGFLDNGTGTEAAHNIL